MADRPVVLVHGYSDTAAGFQAWAERLQARGPYTPDEIDVCSYISLNNEVSIYDIAEAFNRALRRRWPDDQEFDAIVHSTGMLVLRAWLTLYPKNVRRLKHLVGLAPASFGSPVAHMGRSFLGAVSVGSKDVWAPDFLESGDRVLDALELGSKFTWDLAGTDLLGPTEFYGGASDTPWVFVVCGNQQYTGWDQFVNKPGTDGVVRWAGMALNTRKIVVNLAANLNAGPDGNPPPRLDVAPWSHYDAPVQVVDGYNHTTIQSEPRDDLVDLVLSALGVTSADGYTRWLQDAAALAVPLDQLEGEYQQFVVRATDERGDGIADYNLQILRPGADGDQAIMDVSTDPHVYSTDPSYRCFQVDLRKLQPMDERQLTLRITASSGSQLVGYRGVGDTTATPSDHFQADVSLGHFADLQRERYPERPPITLFAPLTTTLIELTLTREAIPFDAELPNNVCWFPAYDRNLLASYTPEQGYRFRAEDLQQAADKIFDKIAGTAPGELAASTKDVILSELKSHFFGTKAG